MITERLIKYFLSYEKDDQIYILKICISDTLDFCERYNINDKKFIDIIFFKCLSHRLYILSRKLRAGGIEEFEKISDISEIAEYFKREFDYNFELAINGEPTFMLD